MGGHILETSLCLLWFGNVPRRLQALNAKTRTGDNMPVEEDEAHDREMWLF